MPTPSDETKPIVRRLTPPQRIVRVLVCVLIVASAFPVSVGPSAAEFTNEEWRFDANFCGQDVADIGYADGKLFVYCVEIGLTPPATLFALDADDGSIIWQTDVGGGVIMSDSMAILPDRDSVYITESVDGIYRYDMNDGDHIANTTGDVDASFSEYEAIDANRNESRLYGVVNNPGDYQVVELDPENGEQIKTRNVDNTPVLITVENGGDGAVFTTGSGDDTTRYNAELTTREWRSDPSSSAFDHANGRVFTTSTALNDTDGSVVANSDDPPSSSPGVIDAPDNSTTVYVPDETGNIVEYNQGDYSEIDSFDITNDDDPADMVTADDTKNEIVVYALTRDEEIVRVDTDTITTEGQENLDLDVPGFMEHGDIDDYSVTATLFNETQEQFVTVDATEDANVTSLNTSLVSIDDAQTDVVATTDESADGTASVRAEYENLTTQEEIVVAEITLDNIEILPPVHRFAATISDERMLIILLATLIGTATVNIATVFAGVSAFTAVILVGWIIGMVSAGVMLSAVFLGAFMGLNIAGNIDYDVRR